MKTIIRIIGLAADLPCDIEGWYIAAYDTDHENELGLGVLTPTKFPENAKRFDDFGAAVAFWRQTSRTVPERPDGKPNRPLTAFTVTMEHVS